MNTPKSPAMVEVDRLPEPNVLEGHYRDHTDKVSGWSEQQVLEAIAAERAEVVRLRSLLHEYVWTIANGGGGDLDLFMAAIREVDNKARAALATPTQGEKSE